MQLYTSWLALARRRHKRCLCVVSEREARAGIRQGRGWHRRQIASAAGYLSRQPHKLLTAAQLASTFSSPACVAPPCPSPLADDANDLELAEVVARAYLPGVHAATLQQAVTARPEQFHVSAARGVAGTEELLELLVAEHLAGGIEAAASTLPLAAT